MNCMEYKRKKKERKKKNVRSSHIRSPNLHLFAHAHVNTNMQRQTDGQTNKRAQNVIQLKIRQIRILALSDKTLNIFVL